MKAVERIYQYIDAKGLKIAEFERNCRLSNGYLKKMKQRNADIGETIMISILENCPEISLDWFVLGNGSMLKTSTSSESPCNPITTPSEPSSDSPIALLIKHIDSLTRENERQRLQIATLESRLGKNEA